MKKHIIDISKWNDSINWDVLAPQVSLAICRVQYGSDTVDVLYKQHVAQLEKRGIPHAAYAYGCYVSVNDAIVEANDFMKRTNSNAKFLVLDCEDDTLKSCGPDNLAAASQAFIDTCKAAGWKVGFYVSHHMYNQYGLNKVKADFLWIPRYGSNKPAYACDLWQYADGETGGWLDGVGKVDLNVLNGDKPLSWFIGGNELNPINPIDPIQPIQKEGIGHATSKYDDGYGVNLYENPADPIFAGRITQKIPYLIHKGYWGGGEKNMICLGNEKQWAYLKHFDVQWFYAYTKYWSGYQIRTYDGPSGNDTGFVDGSEPYQLFNRQDGHVDIGGNRWIREEHVIIK
ncbi:MULTISPECIES: GH25 family lysozyme [Bacillus]|uniref:N-acetylmuramoyl-L-alanine amidase n=1 Tax=Bacillus wiedmannii TaxID=1890302 RepID=A0AB73SF25_9BACI|nr:GH25 family lysozyme [Bacillus wiedmannii]PEK24354.1 N-acetylmuramoyl-L-alanine amidase [Bacillus wiedmannii]HDR3492909.1 N-acetylmuramoyl-L-alanine amidase [Bacillus wiedmannii]